MIIPLIGLVLLSGIGQSTSREPLRLTLQRAIAIAVEDNARVRVAEELSRQAQSRVGQARAGLLPNIDGQATFMNQTRNLEAAGLPNALSVNPVVGPFNVFDVRATGTQTILDLSAIRRYQAAKAASDAARSDVNAWAEQAAAIVSQAYIELLRFEAELRAVEADVSLAEAVLEQAEDLKDAGTGTGMEVTRSQVQLAHQRQRRIVTANARRRAQFQVVRALGLEVDTEIAVDDALEYQQVPQEKMAQALQRALAGNPQYVAQLERESNARLAASATLLERVPSISLFGDYGSTGIGLNNMPVTRTYGVNVRVPIFDGGRRDARRTETGAQYRTEQIRTADMTDQITMEVRIALDSLESADQEVRVAEGGLELAEAELEQARRRYSAGVAPQLEVTQAQTELARARDNMVGALFHHMQARIALAQASGTLRTGDL